MKKAFIISILGIAMSLTSSRGDGFIFMENDYFDGSTELMAPIRLNGAGPYLGADWSVQLAYSFGGNPFAVAADSQTHFFPGSVTGGNPTVDGAGLFFGPDVRIPGYASGPVTFIVQYFNGATYASSTLTGETQPFVISSLETNPINPPGDLVNDTGGGLLASVTVVPEPSTFALAGLASATALIMRRRKK